MYKYTIDGKLIKNVIEHMEQEEVKNDGDNFCIDGKCFTTDEIKELENLYNNDVISRTAFINYKKNTIAKPILNQLNSDLDNLETYYETIFYTDDIEITKEKYQNIVDKIISSNERDNILLYVDKNDENNEITDDILIKIKDHNIDERLNRIIKRVMNEKEEYYSKEFSKLLNLDIIGIKNVFVTETIDNIYSIYYIFKLNNDKLMSFLYVENKLIKDE